MSLFADGDGDLAGALPVLEQALRAAVKTDDLGGQFFYALGACRHAAWRASWDDFVDDDGNGIDDRLEQVVSAFRRGLAYPEMLSSPAVFFGVGQAYEDYGSFDGAMQMYTHVLAGFPGFSDRPQVLLRAAVLCRHPRVNALPRAVEYLEALLEQPPACYADTEAKGRLGFVLAGCYAQQGRAKLARDMYGDCMKADLARRERQRAAVARQRRERLQRAAIGAGGATTAGTGVNEEDTQAEKTRLQALLAAQVGDQALPRRSAGASMPTLASWLADPKTWRASARFHFEHELWALAAEHMSHCLRLPVPEGGLHDDAENMTGGEDDNKEWEPWCDWELLAVSLGRCTEKASALEAMARAVRMNPYGDHSARLRSRIARWDPPGWGALMTLQERYAVRLQKIWRGKQGAKVGRAYMMKERARRKKQNFAATTIQSAWRFKIFRRKLRRQRQLVAQSLSRIANRLKECSLREWRGFVHLVKFHRRRRHRASTSMQLWWQYERMRWRRKRRRARNRNEVAKAIERIKKRTLFKVIKAWEGWVIWIIEVKEPYNATTIQCWWRHLKVS